MKYYVYVFLDPRRPGNYQYGEHRFDYEPFYVGKGKGDRIKNHVSAYRLRVDKNRIKTSKLKKIIAAGFNPLNYVSKIKQNLLEGDALEFERSLIALIGRLDKKKGPLANLRDGGGSAGLNLFGIKGQTYEQFYGKEKAKEIKDKLRVVRLGRKNPMFGNPGFWKGKFHTEESKKKMSLSSSKAIKQLSLDGNLIKIWKNSYEAARFLKVSPSAIHNCVSQKTINLTAVGYKWEYVDTPNLKYINQIKPLDKVS